jgi:hypothetical protein
MLMLQRNNGVLSARAERPVTVDKIDIYFNHLPKILVDAATRVMLHHAAT